MANKADKPAWREFQKRRSTERFRFIALTMLVTCTEQKLGEFRDKLRKQTALKADLDREHHKAVEQHLKGA